MPKEKKIRILHIEKKGLHRATVARGLQRRRFLVFSAADGTEGLSLLRKHCCEVVLCGPRLTDVKGLDVLDQVRRSDPDIPIILLISRWSISIQLEALRLGAVCCTSKPLKVDELASILRRAWENYETRRLSHDQNLRQRLLLENVPDIVYSLNANGELVSVNRAIEAALGYLPAELIGKPIFPMLHPEDLDRVRRGFEQSLAAGEDDVRTLEFRMISKRGEVRHFEVSRRLHFEQGRFVRNDGIARDVTRRKVLEGELQRYSQGLECMVAERTERLEYVNRQLAALNQVSNRFTQIQDEEQLYDAVPDLLTHSLDFGQGILFLAQDGALWLRSFCFDKDPPGPIESYAERIRSGTEPLLPHLRESFDANKTVYVPDPNADPRRLGNPGEQILTRAMLITPIRAQEKPIGLLVGNMQHHAPEMDSPDIARFEMFANMLGLAVENTRAYRSLEGKVQERTRSLDEANAMLSEKARQLENKALELARANGDLLAAHQNLEERQAAMQRLLEELSASRSELQSILDSAVGAIILVNQQGLIVAGNRWIEKFFHVSTSEVLHRPWQLFLEKIDGCFEDPPRHREFAERLRLHPDRPDEELDHTLLHERALKIKGPRVRFLAPFSLPVLDESGHELSRVWIYSDVTKARQADEQLRAIIDAAPTPTTVSRIEDGKIIFANEHLARLVGSSVEGLIGRTTFDFYYLPEERTPLLDRLRRDRLVRNYELRLKRADGTPFWALISMVATELGGEQVIIAGISDISDRKSAEEALQRERNFVSAVLDTAGALVAVLDPSGRFVRFNRTCEQTTGFAYEEIKDRPFWEVFLVPEETARVRAVFEELRAGNFPGSGENYWRTKNRGLRLISWSNTAIVGAGGEVEHIIATGIDITDQRKAEEDLRRTRDQLERRVKERTAELAAINEQLRESEKRLRKQNEVLARLAKHQVPEEDLGASLRILTEAAAETMEVERVGVWLYDEGFSRIVCLDLFERSAQRHSGGMELAAVEYPGYFKALGEQRAIAGDDARSDPRTREFTSSYLVPLGITSMLDAPIWVGGRMAGVICHEHVGEARHWTLEEQQFTASLADYASLAIEAQHRRRAETELQQAHAQLERRVEERTAQLRAAQAQLVQSEKMAALGMLVAGIAHEINTPVGAIHSTHDTLQLAVQKLKSELGRSYRPGEPETITIGSIMKIIEEANLVIASGAGRVADIVRRLKSFARLDEAELKVADIHEGLEDTLVLIHHELKNRITVKRKYGDVPPFACYPGRLNQVFLNVLNNARQAIVGQGEISIATFREGSRAFIEIADSGSGIPPEHLGRIFDPGFTTKGVGVGTGLGLSICYQIVQDHHGEIKVASEAGKGTSFTIILPMDLGQNNDNAWLLKK